MTWTVQIDMVISMGRYVTRISLECRTTLTSSKCVCLCVCVCMALALFVCRTLKSKMYHFTRAAKDHEGHAKKDAEDIHRLNKENEDLKQQVADLAYKYKSAQGYLQRHLSPTGHAK